MKAVVYSAALAGCPPFRHVLNVICHQRHVLARDCEDDAAMCDTGISH